MVMVTEQSTQQWKHTCYWSQKRAHSNRNIHGNGHRREHTAKETFMVIVTEESTQQQKHTC